MNLKAIYSNYIMARDKIFRVGLDKGLKLFKGKATIEHLLEKIQPAV